MPKTAQKPIQNLINHVALVIDASDSMHDLKNDVIRVVDEQIRHLAEESKRLDQETRITVYTFDSEVRCLFYDKDVLRLPSLKEHYVTRGMTALIDATIKSQEDLAETAQLYGDHAFLTFVITDGMENQSKGTKYELAELLKKMPDHWTVATFVPNKRGEDYAVQFGFPVNNIAIWDATSVKGLEDSFVQMRAATSTYMDNRARGIRGTRAVFSTGAEAVNKQSIQQAGLTPLDTKSYILTVVPPEHNGSQIKDFIEQGCGYPYKVRRGYYQLMKREKIQGDKDIAIMDKKTRKVYMGDGARGMIGLGDGQQSVFPNFNPDYEVFVQSGSVNRKMVVGQNVLYLL